MTQTSADFGDTMNAVHMGFLALLVYQQELRIYDQSTMLMSKVVGEKIAAVLVPPLLKHKQSIVLIHSVGCSNFYLRWMI